MKMKRLLGLLLCLTLVLGLLAGCSGQKGGIVPIDDPAAAQADPSILTEKLLAKAAANPVITSESHPRWTGFTLGYFDNLGERGTTPKTVELCAEWGFNSARVFLPYTTLFNIDVTEANLTMLHKLDEMVAAAIEHDIHLNIMLAKVPGRTVHEGDASTGYVSTGEFDLFINEEKQSLALDVYRILTARYKDVPNYNLSITPFFEALNKDLSTGLPYEDYTPEDVAAFLGKVIDTIREEDPDRLIIYEPTAFNHEDAIIEASTPIKAVADTRGNVMISYNFCQTPYVYACMTATPGKHIDNMNSSMFIPEYPHYIYAVAGGIWVDAPIILDGFLPAGTTIDFYLERSHPNTTLDISVDGESRHRENLSATEYQISERLGVYYPYATSEKQISITLTEDADEITVSCLNDGGVDFSGILLTFPEEYAVERWYFAQSYDVYMGTEKTEGVQRKQTSSVMLSPNYHDAGRHITIHDDLTFTSDRIAEEASSETIAAWSEAIEGFDGNCVIRFERADFSGGIWPEMKEYYEDLLQSFEEYGYSWWSNDWWLMTEEYAQTKVVAESPIESCADYPHFNREMLELFQKYQSKD